MIISQKEKGKKVTANTPMLDVVEASPSSAPIVARRLEGPP